MKSIINNAKFLILLDQAVFSGTSFITTVLVARLLDINSFGAYSGYLLGIYLAVSGIGAFVIQPFQVLLAKSADHKQYATFAFWLQLVSIVLLLLLGFLFLQLFPGIFPATLLWYAGGFLLHDFGRRLLLALNKPLQTLLFDSTASLFSLLVLYYFSKLVTKDLSHLYLLSALVFGISLLLLFVFVRPFTGPKSGLMHHLHQHISQGKWLFFTALTQWWSGNLFVVASGLYLGPAALGALRLAQSLLGVLSALLQTFENYVLPQTAIKISQLRSDGIAYVAAASKKASLLFVPILIITFLFAENILVLAGGDAYLPYAFVLQGMSLLYGLIFISQPIRLLIRALLLNQHFFYGYVISIVFSLLCSHALLASFGLTGAIIGLAISQILVMTYWSFVLQHQKINLWKSFISS